MYDIAIIGLGPGGSLFASRLSPQFKVIAFDKKGDGPFKKPCGGLLAPDAQRFFSRLNINLPKEVMVDPQIFSVKTIDFNSSMIRHYQRFYLNINRHKFDTWLKSQIPPFVEIYSDSNVTSIVNHNSHWAVTYTCNGQTYEIKAKIIVGADGANSIVRRTCFPKSNIRKYVAIQQWMKDNNPHPSYVSIFDSSINDCYSWGLTKDEYFIFGGAYPIKNCRKLFLKQKEKCLPHLESLAADAIKTEACLVLRPSRFSDFALGGNNAFLLGEAAGFISPSSFEGISYALESGYILANVLNSNSPHPLKEYRKKTFKIRAKIMKKVLKSVCLYTPFLRKLILKSGIQSLKMI